MSDDNQPKGNKMKTIEVDGEKFDLVPHVPATDHSDKRLVIVRSRDSGVKVGRLMHESDGRVELADARGIWYWKGANTLLDMATDGVANGSKISKPVPTMTIIGACEIIDVQPSAIASLTTSGWPV